MPNEHQDHQPRHNWVLLGFIAVAAFFLLTEHTAHLMGALPYLLAGGLPVDAPVHASRTPPWPTSPPG